MISFLLPISRPAIVKLYTDAFPIPLFSYLNQLTTAFKRGSIYK